jgi:hypothetical protein
MRKKKEPTYNPTPPVQIPSTVNGYGRPLRCQCQTPDHAKLGATWLCPFCGQLWKYTHDNIASCFWVHAGPFKKLAHRFTRGS